MVLAGGGSPATQGAQDADYLRQALEQRLGLNVDAVDPRTAATLMDRITANGEVLARCSTEPMTGALAWAATRVGVVRVGGADGSLILFAGSNTEHPEHDRG